MKHRRMPAFKDPIFFGTESWKPPRKTRHRQLVAAIVVLTFLILIEVRFSGATYAL